MVLSHDDVSQGGDAPETVHPMAELLDGECRTAPRRGENIQGTIMSITPAEILEVNIPTAIPLSYTFDQDWNVVDKHYIGDPDVIAAKIDAVANQGKAKK